MSLHKELVINISKQSYRFHFEILKEYRNIRFANGKHVVGHGFFIHVHDSPNQQQFLNDGEFHFINTTNPPLICWDALITNFKDAKHVMFTWAKNYAQHAYDLTQNRPGYSQAESHPYWFEELRASIRQDQYQQVAFQSSITGRLVRWFKQKLPRGK